MLLQLQPVHHVELKSMRSSARINQTSHMYSLLQDVGFDYKWKVGKDNQVIDVYFHHHFPKAVRPPPAKMHPAGLLRSCHNCIPALDHLWLT